MFRASLCPSSGVKNCMYTKWRVYSQTQMCVFKMMYILELKSKRHVSAIHGHHQVLSNT